MPIWERCRDVCNGEESVKLKRTQYLPRPEGMEESEYTHYLERAEFFNATGRTVDGLHGQMFRKSMIIDVPEQMKQYLENVDGKGHSFEQFASDVVYQTLITSWGGILIDAPNVQENLSKADAEKLGIYPFLSYVNEQSLYSWHYDDMARVKTLTRVGIHTRKEYPTSDPFTFEEKDEYKLLLLDENGNYKQVIKVDGVSVSEIYPTKGGKEIKHLPFFTVPNTEPENPIIKDLANENLAWYRKSADLENGGHWTGVPTAYILGYEPEIQYDNEGREKARDPIYLGGSSILCLPTGTQIGYLEYQGAGLSQLRQMMLDDEDRMAILGARIISAERKGVEAVETARIHRSGENSVLATFANNMSIIFEKVLKEYLEWITETEISLDEIKVHINTDYDVSKMSSQEVTTIVSAWQSGLISKRVAFEQLREGEIIPSDMKFEEQEEIISAEKEEQLQQSLQTQIAMQNVGTE